jgi:NADH:ubiquinone oxidoreductase subunit 5 (subunit L)/multisubunit Na+/H+ antiporter MnhA subunit/multisubunit Na+/H+ antiporter MnhB subunit
VPFGIQIAAATVALPFAGAMLIALLRAAGWRDAPHATIAVACSAATVGLAAVLWLAAPHPVTWRAEWIPAAGISFGLQVDGLSLLFTALVAGVGLLTFLYSAVYLPRTSEGRGREGSIAGYYAYLLLLTGAMLGLVFSADLIQLYVFWELLDLAAFLLIGLNWRSPRARASAVTVLLFTTLGGLALLVSVVLIGSAAGTFWIPEILERAELVRASPLFAPALLLVILGAASKAAQFPLHVWLPRAMAAPTPVNALEDSATVLAAGVFLLARLHPLFAGDPLWTLPMVAVGVASMLAGGILALTARDLKVILAYSTISQFGFVFVLLGYGGDAALAAALFFLFQHALLKSGLFFVVGAVGSTTGVWVLGRTRGLWRRLPLTFGIACVLALSLGGVPPLAGFWMKEAFFGKTLDSGAGALLVLAVVGSALTTAYLLRFLAGTFWSGSAEPGPLRVTPGKLLLAPGLLAGLTLLFGLRPGLATEPFAQPAAAAVLGRTATLDFELHLGPVLLLSLLALALGALGFAALRVRALPLTGLARVADLPGGAYRLAAGGVGSAGAWVLRLQNGILLRYTFITLLALLGLVGFAVLAAIIRGEAGFPPLPGVTAAGFDWRMALLLLLVCAGTLLTFLLREHLPMVLALGAVGYLMAGVFALALAPNLGLLQVHVETLVTVLLVLPLAAIPREVRERLFVRTRERLTVGRLALAGVAGVGAAWVSWLAIEHLPPDPVAPWYSENAPELVGATDIVAAVLIHFRALDTLGEIIVFATAAAGVFALSHLIRKESR